jgi:hypothetical protein
LIRSNFKLDNFTKRIARQLDTRRKERLLRATMSWHEGVVEELSGQRAGRLYKIPGTGQVKEVVLIVNTKHPRYKVKQYARMGRSLEGAKLYHASKPGEAPAVRLGQLRQTYRFRVTGPNYMERGEVGSPLERSVWLEKGTSRMAARPHLEPAYYKKRKEILKHLGKRLDD